MSLSTDEWIDEVTLPVLDRSTLELWATCPQQAAWTAGGVSVRESSILLSGIEAHEALSVGIREYVGMRGDMRPADMVDVVTGSANFSRPDVQPDVISALRPSLWAWAKFVCDEIHAENILRFDGGKEERSGQLAIDLEWPNVRVTSEVDLLYAGPSPEVLHEVDYKTGHKQWTSRDVADSFQFQLHAVLVFANYPAVNALEVTIWNTRHNSRSYRVVFHRKDLTQYRARIVRAAKVWSENQGKKIGEVPTWPEQDKCSMCHVAQHCIRLDVTSADPVNKLRNLIVLEAAAGNLKKQLAAHVKVTGKDVVTPEGDAFGQCKPASFRAKPNAIYKITSDDVDD